MEFDINRPIYLQITDAVCNSILEGELKGEDRIPSVREYGAKIGVNPNTVARSYEALTSQGVIYNKRGIGFFVCENARENILKAAREKFLKEDLPNFLELARRLDIGKEELVKLI